MIEREPVPELAIAIDLISGALERAESLRQLAEMLAGDEYVSEEPRQLLSVYGKLSGPLAKSISYQYQLLLNGDRYAFSALRAIDLLVRDLTGDLRLPGRAIRNHVPGVLTRLVAERIRSLFPDAAVILRPAWKYQFKVYPQDVRSRLTLQLQDVLSPDSAAHLPSILSDLPEHLYIISFPIIERASIHLHSVLGHEIGHLLAERYAVSDASDTAFKEELRRKFPIAQARKSTQRSLEFEDTDSIQKNMAAKEKAAKELYADTAAVLLFGISALFGAAQIALGTGLSSKQHDYEPRYPSWGLRLYSMLDVAKKEGWLDVPSTSGRSPQFRKATDAVARHIEALKKWVGESPERWLTTDEKFRLGHSEALKHIGDVVSALKLEYGASLGVPSRTYSVLAELFARLVRGVPPDSTGRKGVVASPARLEDVLTAAWWYRISLNEASANSPNSYPREEHEQLSRLTLKAIENIDMMTRFTTGLEQAWAQRERRG